MPKRIVLQSIHLYRDGKRVTPEIKKPFDFTADELKQITAVNKNALGMPPAPSDAEIAKAKSEDAAKAKAEKAEADKAAKAEADAKAKAEKAEADKAAKAEADAKAKAEKAESKTAKGKKSEDEEL